MRKIYSVLVATIVGILFVSSCSEKSISPESQQTQSMQVAAFSTAIPIAEMNAFIKLTPAPDQDFRNGSSMFLEVENQSQKTQSTNLFRHRFTQIYTDFMRFFFKENRGGGQGRPPHLIYNFGWDKRAKTKAKRGQKI